MRIETKLFENGITIFNPSPKKGENPAFFYFDFTVIPRVGELIILHDAPGGMYIVVAVTNEIIEGKCKPLIALEKHNGQTRQSILEQFGWLSGVEIAPNAFEAERIIFEN